MNKAQKKILLIFTSIILLIAFAISVTVLVLGYVKDDKLLKLWGTISTIVSPSTFVGVLIKIIVNKFHLKAIDKHFIENGIKPLKKENEVLESKEIVNNKVFHYLGHSFYRNKDRIIVKVHSTGKKEEDFNSLKLAFGEYLEFERKSR